MALMVIEVFISPTGMPSRSWCMWPEVDDRDADLAHLPGRLGGVGVVAGLGGEVEGDGQAGLPRARLVR